MSAKGGQYKKQEHICMLHSVSQSQTLPNKAKFKAQTTICTQSEYSPFKSLTRRWWI